jgi:hypothetical protein
MAAITKNRNFFKWPKLLYYHYAYTVQIWALSGLNRAVLAI